MRFFTTFYVLLLAYIIAALLFWGLSLQKRSKENFEQERIALIYRTDSLREPERYKESLQKLIARREMRKKQYVAEGATFFIVILIGAGVVYTSFRRSIRLSRQQNNFMLAVTHELKSPIAGIKLSLQTIQKRALTEEQRQTLIARCIEESDRLNDLCNNMLITSQMEGRHYIAAKEKLDFSELVQDSTDLYYNRYPGRFVVSIEDDVNVNGDMTLLQMAINNLLENAVKYTPPVGKITVSLFTKKTRAFLHVADNGKGIPENEKKKIFSKFYRIGDEATRNTKGTGLGLYLTSRIIRQHKGKLCVRDNKPAGALFEICLPLA